MISRRRGGLELLAPAGNYESLQQAILYGADAVYLGGLQFGMRQASANFSEVELKTGIELAHQNDVRIYLTCNTLPRQDELDGLPDFMLAAEAAGVDALIVTDMGVMALARKVVPHMELHMSTQTGVVNSLAATELHRLGASRVILARELTLPEIADMRTKTPKSLIIEAFVHGAMCMSVSGRCVISNYLTGRDANRGACAQPCRWNYRLVEEKRPGEYFPVGEEAGGSYILNSKDLCMLQHIDKLAAAGISSFKIEGRAKSPYYVAIATKAYRAALDSYIADPEHYNPAPWMVEELNKISHRSYSTGFYLPDEEPGQCHDNGGYERDYQVAALVIGSADGYIEVLQKNRFCKGDIVELVGPDGPPVSFAITSITDADNNCDIEVANRPQQRLFIPSSGLRTNPGSYLRQKVE